MLSYKLVLYCDMCIVSLKYIFYLRHFKLDFFTLHYIHSNKHTLCVTVCNNNTNQITDINTLWFMHKLCNFRHIISTQSNVAAVTLYSSSSGQIHHGCLATSDFGRILQIESGTSLLMYCAFFILHLCFCIF